MPTIRDSHDRWSAKIDKSGPIPEYAPHLGPCWVWTGAISSEGYGRCGSAYAHRWSYEVFVGPIPEGLQIDHLCRVRKCVNPAHLEPVTQRENLLRGDGAGARFARRTHCSRGHALTPENTYAEKASPGARMCLACKRLGRKRSYEAKKRRQAGA